MASSHISITTNVVVEYMTTQDATIQDAITEDITAQDTLIKDTRYIYTSNDLFVACYHGIVHHVTCMIKCGTDIHARNDLAFRIACKTCNYDLVTALLDCGANIHTLDDLPLRDAVYCENIKLIELLLRHDANVRAHNDDALKNAWKNKRHHVFNTLMMFVSPSEYFDTIVSITSSS